MTILTVTAKGQLTLRKDVLVHLGVKPGDKIELDMLPDGKGVLKAARPAGDVRHFIGLLADKSRKPASLHELDEAIAQGWSGRK